MYINIRIIALNEWKKKKNSVCSRCRVEFKLLRRDTFVDVKPKDDEEQGNSSRATAATCRVKREREDKENEEKKKKKWK